MIAVLLILLLFAVLQVSMYFYARNVIAASAADAARYAAAAGVPPSAGAARAEQLIADGLGGKQAHAIACTSGPGVDADTGLAVTTVHCTGHVRALMIATDLPLTVDFTSSALKETAP